MPKAYFHFMYLYNAAYLAVFYHLITICSMIFYVDAMQIL